MILFEGYMGTILHTGDFRFDDSMLCMNEYSHLYPPSKRRKRDEGETETGQERTSIQIDELILDNTFCDPIFDFPSQSTALAQISTIIEQQTSFTGDPDSEPISRVYLRLDTLGKEEMLIEIAQQFQSQIVVPPARMDKIKATGNLPLEFFTTNRDEG